MDDEGRYADRAIWAGIAIASNGKLYAIGGSNSAGHLFTVEEFGAAQ